MSSQHQQSPPSELSCPGGDIHVYCFNCDYNLTYCRSDRCPECGAPFNHEDLLDWSGRTTVLFRGLLPRGTRKPAIPLMTAAMFHPSRLGREIPAAPNEAGIRDLSATYRLLATGILGVCLAMVLMMLVAASGHEVILLLVPVVLAAVWIGSRLCEELIRIVLEMAVRWRFSPSLRSDSHLAMALPRLFAAFLPIHAIAGVMALVLGVVFYPLAIVVEAGIFLWWWYGLSRAIVVRSVPTFGRAVAILFVPIAAAVAEGVGVFGIWLFVRVLSG